MHFIIIMIYCALLGKNAALNKFPVAEKAEEMILQVVFVLCDTGEHRKSANAVPMRLCN